MNSTEKILKLLESMLLQSDDLKALRALNKDLCEVAQNGMEIEAKIIIKKVMEEHLRRHKLLNSDFFTPLANIMSACLSVKIALAEMPLLIESCLAMLKMWEKLEDPQQILRVLIQTAQTSNPALSLYPKVKQRLYELMGYDTFPPEARLLSGTMYHLINFHLSLVEIPLKDDNAFRHVCLIHGFLTASSRKPPECLRSELQDLLPVIIALCQQNTSQFHFFHKIKTLDLWLTIWNEVRGENQLTALFVPDGPVFTVVNSNWESSIPGVPELVKTSMTLLLHCQTEVAGPRLLDMVLNSLSWRLKSKYLTLSVVIPFLPKQQVLNYCQELAQCLLQSLPVNHLATVGTETYKVLLNQLSYEEFTCHVRGSFMKALTLDNSIALENCHHSWLPFTLTKYPDLWVWLMDALATPRTLPEHLSLIMCLKVGRNKGLVTDASRLWPLIGPALQHSNDSLRSAAFHCVAFARKKSQALTPEERKLTLQFLAFNLNVDNPAFRQNVMSSLKNLLLRVFESALPQLKSPQSSTLNDTIMFVEQLHNLLHKSLRPGASFQRRFLALDAMQLIIQFVYDPVLVSLSKGCTLAKREQLRDIARMKGCWDFTNENLLPAWLACLRDDVADIRQKAAKLLCSYFCPSPAYAISVFEQGWLLCDSPKLQECEAGALLLHVAYVWASQSSDLTPNQTEKCGYPAPLRSCGVFSERLTSQLSAEFALLKTNFLQAATSAPLHGFVTAIRYHYELHGARNCLDQQETLYELLLLCGDIVRHMLDCLSCKSDCKKDTAPSFEAMGDSVDEIIRQSMKESLPQTVSITGQQQIVQACAWLTIKECAFLVACLGSHLLKGPLSMKATQTCLGLLADILIRCRHKGAIESAGEACATLCRIVLSAPEDELRQIPRDILCRFLQSLGEQECGASITRRSAGLAFLVVKIVSSEPNKTRRHLVVLAVEKLMSIATQEIAPTCDMTVDMPSAQALHILQTLVHDASLVPDLSPYMSQILQLCVPLLSSSAWTVRNAALQLYGSLVPRLVGQKKVREDHGQPNTITLDEFFTKYPELHDFLLEQLQAHTATLTPQVNASLVPILSLMAKLSPGLVPNASVRKLAFKTVLNKLMASPVIYIRSLAAQAITALTGLLDLPQLLVEYLQFALDERDNSNALHGYLLAIRCLALRLQDTGSKDWPELRQQIKQIEAIEQRHVSYFIKVTIVDLFCKLGLEMSTDEWYAVLENRENVPSLLNRPGFPSWLRLKTKLVVSKCPLSSLICTSEHALAGKGEDAALAALQVLSKKLPKMSPSSVIANSVMSFVTYYILKGDLMRSSLPVSFGIVLQRGASCLSNDVYEWLPEYCLKYLRKDIYGEVVASLALPVLALVMIEAYNKPVFTEECAERLLDNMANYMSEFSQPNYSVTLRMGAANALVIIGRQIFCPKAERKLLQPVCEMVLQSVLRLLQDEDKEVRLRVASMFPGLSAPAHCLGLMVESFTSDFVETDVITYAWQILKIPQRAKDTWLRLSRRDWECLFEEAPRNPFAEESRVHNEWNFFVIRMIGDLHPTVKQEIRKKLSGDLELLEEEIAQLLPIVKECEKERIVWSPAGCAEGYSALVKLKNRMDLAEALWEKESFREMKAVMATWGLFDA